MRHTTFALVLAAAAVASPLPAGAGDVGGEALQVVEGRSGVDPGTGFVRIRGEVWNRSGRWVRAPQVAVELFDEAGKPIAVTGFLAEVKRETGSDPRDGVLAERYYLPPGEAAVFEYLRDPKKLGGKKYASHKLSATAWALPGEGPKATVEGFRPVRAEDGTWEVSGTIQVAGSQPCRSPKAVLAFYAADGKVTHATYEEPEATFQKEVAPGHTVAFSRKAIPDPEGAREAKAWGDCAHRD